MATLSVVVANRDAPRDGRGAAAALARELHPGDEVLWVDRTGAGAPAELAGARVVEAPGGADRGTCYGLGLAVAGNPFVAFTDSRTVVGAGWRPAAVAALDAGATFVGGPVIASEPRSRRGWAGFFVDYGPHAVAPYTSASGDISGNNVAYRRDALPDDGAPVWKHAVDARLHEAGIRPVVIEGMTVTVERDYGWSDLGPARVGAGALYARQRASGWPARRRWLAAVGCAVLPALATARLGRRVRADAHLRPAFVRASPLVVAALVAWSIGEARGYLRPGQEAPGVW